MTSIHITLIVYALDITPLVVSLAGPDVTFHIFQHGTNPEIVDLCEALACDIANVHYYDYRQNRGLARSWNQGLLASRAMDADVMVLLNDDIQASRDDLLVLANAAVEHRESGIIEVQGWDGGMQRQQGMNFGFCAINPIALWKVGYFDENFFPIYFEDSDYSRRCGLRGVTFYDAGPTGVRHVSNATIKSSSELGAQNRITFHANREYYCRKHGGEPGQETFLNPFGDADMRWKIDEGDRHDPYPYDGYDRTDREIVKI